MKTMENSAVEKEIAVEDKAFQRERVYKTRDQLDEEARQIALDDWKPKTELGRQVKAGKIKDIDSIIDQKILEYQILDLLISVESDLLMLGQSKGKFGGGKRRAWKQTQRKTMEGNIPTFSTGIVVGDKNGHVGLGFGRSKETLPAKEKALRKAKLAIMKITRGCASFDCLCEELHTVPFKVRGKCGSCVVELIPAPQGTGLVIGNECKKILKLAGIKDVYSKTYGQTRSTINLAKACIEALKQTNRRVK